MQPLVGEYALQVNYICEHTLYLLLFLPPMLCSSRRRRWWMVRLSLVCKVIELKTNLSKCRLHAPVNTVVVSS